MYHPSHHVLSLDEAEQFFARVFGRPSSVLPVAKHSIFTPIADVLFDTIDPERYVVAGKQRYASIERPHLQGFGWYVEGIEALYRSLREHGFTVIDQLDEVAAGDEPPTAAGSPVPLFFTVPSDAGLRYEFLPRIPFPLDLRLDPGWTLPPVSDDDPLGIVRCAHHTVLTGSPDRALRLAVDVLGGKVVDSGRDDLLACAGPYVQVADAVVHYASPDEGTPAHADWRTRAPADTHHSIAWQVADLDRTARHLVAEGVTVTTRTDEALVTDPTTSLGIPWVFLAGR
jgi:hypothetical protein